MKSKEAKTARQWWQMLSISRFLDSNYWPHPTSTFRVMVLNILRSLSVDFIHSELLYSPPFYVVTCHAAIIFCVVAALELKSRSPGRW